MRELGTIKRIDAREVWKHEALEFTPWLKENITLLGSALGLDLDLVESEVPVGPFSADLVAKDVSNDRWVVIENQLAPTDHSHLGQLLTYGASTKQVSVFIWISPEFREEHRAALDWLNEHSDESSLFFAIVIELLAVDDSKPAPNFRLVSFPNDWSKGGGGIRGRVSEKGAAYAEFFSELLAAFKERFPGETNVSKASSQNWLSMSIGRAGLSTGWAFTADRRFRAELYIDAGTRAVNDFYFEQLEQNKKQVESQIEHALDWDPLEGSRGCRISSYYPTSPVSVLDEDSQLEPLKAWAVDEMKSLRDLFRPLIRSLQDEGVPNDAD